MFILNYINDFDKQYQDFIIHNLIITYPLIHSSKFQEYRRKNEQNNEQIINDKLFQTQLTLKQWCRLKIRKNLSQTSISALNLSIKLTEYCSCGLSNPNFASHCIQEVS